MINNAIGIFDSGVGGLTVLKEIKRILPSENLFYFGDTARVPYGTKSKLTIIRYAQEISGFLIKKGIKLLVIACNTATALALDEIQKNIDIPVIGVIKPGCMGAIKETKNKNICVIGTSATISSKAYYTELIKLDNNISVLQIKTPLFVPFIEEGIVSGEILQKVIEMYLNNIKDKLDTLVLGCTHYPLIKSSLEEFLGNEVSIVDSAIHTADEVNKLLEEKNIKREPDKEGIIEYFVSDDIEKFKKIGEEFLGEKINNINHVSDFI